VIERIVTAPGASKVVFSPNGQLAYVNHLQAMASGHSERASLR
jgi:hypothetical protein